MENICVDIFQEVRTRQINSNLSSTQTSEKVQICDSGTGNTFKKSSFRHITSIGLKNPNSFTFYRYFCFFPFNKSEAVISIHI